MAPQVLAVPKWLIVIRGIQLFLSLVVLGLSAYGVYWVTFNAWGFAIFTSVATLIIVLYGILTTKITAWSKGYNYWAIVALDAVLVIFWLAAMGALAATRAAFVYPVSISGCYNTGSVGGGICVRELTKRDAYVATYGYLNMMSGAAGISAIEFILFVVTLIFSSIALHRTRRSAQAGVGPTTNDKLEAHPMEPVQQQQQVPAQYEQPQPQYQQPPVQYQQQPYTQAPQQQQYQQ